MAKAAGWGRMASPDVNQRQSPVLRKVDLFVSTKKYKHSQMFGTMLEKNSLGEYKDPCSGDSGVWNVNILYIFACFFFKIILHK